LRTCVIDSSVVVKWYVPENLSQQAALLLRRARNGTLRLLAPDLVFPEVGNILWKKQRLGELEAASAARILRAVLKTFPARVLESRPLLPAAFRIASAFERTVYDALYIAAAQATGAPLVTADQRLVNSLKHGPLADVITDLREI